MVECFLDTEEVAGSIPASPTTMHYTEITDQFRADFFKLTDKTESTCITTHISADDDAIASILAAYRILSDKYPAKNIQVICTGEPNNRFRSFQNFEKIQFVPDAGDYFNKFDLLLLLDGGNYHRFTPKPDKLKEFQGKTICVDHHGSPADEFSLTLVAPGIPSTAEIIYLVFCKNAPVDKPLAEIFLLGILGDTGNFSYLKPDQTETFLTAKRLVEEGAVEIVSLQARYRTLEPKTLASLGELIKNTTYHKINSWPDFQTSFLNRESVHKNNLTDKEASEATGIYTAFFVKSVIGYSWGFAIRPKTNGECSISFRSLPGSVNVRELAERMRIGGGHDRAAGGTFKEKGKVLDPKECLDKVLDWISKNEPVIG